MNFLPHFPLSLNAIALFGLTLILGIVSGEIVSRSKILPKISGYLMVGFLVGPSVFNIVTPSLFAYTRLFVDISLGLILFDLGRHLNFTWLRHDRGIFITSFSESLLTFFFVFVALYLFHFPLLHAAIAATIAVSTSPAVVMMIANDLSSEGPVTRRTLILTSLNNLFALILFTILLPFTQTDTSHHYLLMHTSYRLFGSIVFGILMFILTICIAKFIGKRKENQFVLFVAVVIFAIGFSNAINLSSMLALFTLGVAARNFDRNHVLIEIDFGLIAKLFFILLFVITGIHLQLKGLWQATGVVCTFIIVRTLAKSCGVHLFAKMSNLTKSQTWLICLALTPMSGLAIGMSHLVIDFNSNLGYQLMTLVATSVAMLNVIGPIATQLAFIKADEAILKINFKRGRNEFNGLQRKSLEYSGRRA